MPAGHSTTPSLQRAPSAGGTFTGLTVFPLNLPTEQQEISNGASFSHSLALPPSSQSFESENNWKGTNTY